MKNLVNRKIFSDLVPAKLLHYRYRRRQIKILNALNFGSEANQYFLVSYPKSGNTWVRFLLANLLAAENESLDLRNIGNFVPDIHVKSQFRMIYEKNTEFSCLEYQFIKTHYPYQDHFSDKNIILLVRDGRDVITSYFHYLNSRRSDPISLPEIITGKSIDGFGLWSDHVTGWFKGKARKKVVIRYEDLKRNPHSAIKNLADELEWQLSDKQIKRAVDNSTFDKLAAKEIKIGGINPSPKDDIRFFRKGQVGDWANTFSEENLQLFWDYHREGMDLFNYGSAEGE
ncbi:MAG: sulfotransferase domain-containing protein [Anaerolineales bacterium]|nr:sulfotransferase domain-containing protein [Anaerolineales bacterium]